MDKITETELLQADKNCTKVLAQKSTFRWYYVGQPVQSTQSQQYGAGAFGLATDIWVILWPEANSTTAACLEMRSN